MKQLIAGLLPFLSFLAVGQQWSPVGTYTGHAQSLGTINSTILLGKSANGTASLSVQILSELNNGTWQNIAGSETWSSSGNIFCLREYKGKLYAGGQFVMVNGSNIVANFAVKETSGWAAVGGTVHYNSFVYGMHEYNNQLYVAGSFSTIGSNTLNCVGSYNGNTWTALGTGLNPEGLAVGIQNYNNDIYFAGMFSSAGGVAVTNIAKWNGTNWSAVGTVSVIKCLSAGKMAVYKNELYVTGMFATAAFDTLFRLAKWNGSNWKYLAPELSTSISDLCVHNNLLYASGSFTSMGGVAANNIAAWNGTAWAPLETGLESDTTVYVTSLLSMPDGLYAAGKFTIAGGQPVSNVARWSASAVGFNEQVTKIQQAEMYPNPTQSGLLFIFEGESAKVVICDATGIFLESFEIKKDERIDCSKYPSGIYIVKIETVNSAGWHRLIIE
jgi:hypothetical protein